MKAVVFSGFGDPDVLEVADRPQPVPEAGQVRVRVTAAAVGPFDLFTRSGGIVQAGMVPAPSGAFEWGLGWDFSGRVDAVGAGVELAAGQPVVGMQPAVGVRTGAQAGYVVADAGVVAAVPESVDPIAAAALPLDGLTALAAMEAAAFPAGTHLLVLGGAGGIDHFAVQLALRAGLRVTATARTADRRALLALGAAVVDRDALPSDVDAVLDTAGLGIAALRSVRDGGTLVTLSGPVEAERGIRSVPVRVSALDRRGERLADLARLVERGGLTLPQVFPLPIEQVARAHERLAAGGVGGRLLLIP